MKTAVGIDLGGTQIKAVVATESGEILRRELRPTGENGSASAFPQTIRALANELGADLPVGISAPGLASSDRRTIAHLPNRLHGIERLDWTSFIQRDQLIPVTNDAQSALIGEAWIGAARGVRDAILITLGTGVGGAILSDGRILRGHIGRAGHIGHLSLDPDGPLSIVGMPGALECWIGNYNVGERSAGRFGTTHELIAAFKTGDDFAREVWLRSIHGLACAIASLVNVLDPEAVIIGGGIAQANDALFEPLRVEMANIEWRPGGHAVQIRPAELGEWAGAIGAARTALTSGT
jgi:glucokinase